MRTPLALAEIIGQPAVRHLAAYVQAIRQKPTETTSRCFGLVGPQGTGKSASALAVAHELGCDEHRFGGGLTVVDCSQFGVDDCKELFGRFVKLSVDTPYRWRVVILEEFERISDKAQIALKYWLDDARIAGKLCVIATSNELSGIQGPVLSRFKVMPYTNDRSFLDACQARLKHLWSRACHGAGMPDGYTAWGRNFKDQGYDMRQALKSFQEALCST